MEINAIKAILKVDSEDYNAPMEVRKYAERLLKQIEQTETYDMAMYSDADKIASNICEFIKGKVSEE